MNGDNWMASVMITKQSAIVHPSARYLWVEENDPRGENVGGWVINATAATLTPPWQVLLLLTDQLRAWRNEYF